MQNLSAKAAGEWQAKTLLISEGRQQKVSVKIDEPLENVLQDRSMELGKNKKVPLPDRHT